MEVTIENTDGIEFGPSLDRRWAHKKNSRLILNMRRGTYLLNAIFLLSLGLS